MYKKVFRKILIKNISDNYFGRSLLFTPLHIVVPPFAGPDICTHCNTPYWSIQYVLALILIPQNPLKPPKTLKPEMIIN